MGNVIPFKKKPEKIPAEVAAAHLAVDNLRHSLSLLPSDQSRVIMCQILMSQLILWIIKSNYYNRPAEVIRTWVNKKIDDYTKQSKEG